jgi:hypothetical protein
MRGGPIKRAVNREKWLAASDDGDGKVEAAPLVLAPQAAESSAREEAEATVRRARLTAVSDDGDGKVEAKAEAAAVKTARVAAESGAHGWVEAAAVQTALAAAVNGEHGWVEAAVKTARVAAVSGAQGQAEMAPLARGPQEAVLNDVIREAGEAHLAPMGRAIVPRRQIYQFLKRRYASSGC